MPKVIVVNVDNEDGLRLAAIVVVAEATSGMSDHPADGGRPMAEVKELSGLLVFLRCCGSLEFTGNVKATFLHQLETPHRETRHSHWICGRVLRDSPGSRPGVAFPELSASAPITNPRMADEARRQGAIYMRSGRLYVSILATNVCPSVSPTGQLHLSR